MGKHLHGRASPPVVQTFTEAPGVQRWVEKFEPAWDFVIRLKQLSQMRPMLEAVLSPVKTPELERDPHGVRSSVPESI